MSVMVNPYLHRKGANTAIGAELGDEQAGLAINWISGRILVRGHTTEFLGGLNDGLLTYASPSTKYVVNGFGVYEAGTTMRCDHDPATLDTSSTAMNTLGIGFGAVVQKALSTTNAVTYQVGQIVRLTDAGDITKWVLGKVVSFSAGALVVNCFDASGYFAASSWRIIVALGVLVEEQRTNGIRNPRAIGGGTGAVLPTNWNGSLAGNGVTMSGLGTSQIDGVDCYSVNLNGTLTAGAGIVLAFDGVVAGQIPAAPGDVWAPAAFLRNPSGKKSGPVALQLTLRESDASGAFLRQTLLDFAPVIDGRLRKHVMPPVTIGANTASLQLGVRNGSGIGTVFDNWVLDMGWPTLEKAPFASSPVLPPVGQVAAATRAADNITMPISVVPYSQDNVRIRCAFRTAPGTSDTFDQRGYTLSDGTANNRLTVIYGKLTSQVAAAVFSGGNGMANLASAVIAFNSVVEVDFHARQDNFRASFNGGADVVDTNGIMPTGVNVIAFGKGVGNVEHLNGHLRSFAITAEAA